MAHLVLPPDKAQLDKDLRRLQIVLPLVILASVGVYSFVMAWLSQTQIAPWVRLTIEFLFFGLGGACIVWYALGWLRRYVASQLERDREARAQERILATITASSADAITLLNNDGYIQSWNRGAELLFGYQPAEAVGKHFTILVPADRREELELINAQLQEKDIVRDWITQRVTRDGRLITVDLTRTLLRDEKGAVLGSSAILRDVTEREQNAHQIREMNRQLELQVAQRTRELAESNRELRRRQNELENANTELMQLDGLKSEFVSLVSHELRAPLANISGSLELLLSDANNLNAHQRELLTLAGEQVARLARLVRGILNVSRIESGQTLLHRQAFDIGAIIERMCSQWQFCDNEHTYRADVGDNLPSVWADRDRIEEVLTNLFENAYKYSDTDTEIRVSAAPHHNEMIIAVRDHGKGIEPQALERIFDKFYRVETDDARKTYGYGLGLYISIKLVEAMDGKLWAESEPNRGSTFYFSLPLAGHAAMGHAPALVVN